MRVLTTAAIAAALAAAPASVVAQSGTAEGVAALARGDYQRAAAILRPMAEAEGAAEPAAQFFLGSMYDAGLGVPQDRLRACALFQRASTGAEPIATAAMRLHKAGFRRHGAAFLADCSLIANIGFDHRFEPVTFELAAGHSIAWSLAGAEISYAGRTTRHEMRLAGRGAAYLPLRYTPLHAPDFERGVRHFVEVFIWQPAPKAGWSPHWHLFEVAGSELLRVTDDDRVMTSPVRPGPSSPEDFRQRTAVRITANGNAEWLIADGANSRSGLIESDAERREVREREARRRAALDQVDWKRRFDARRVPSLSYGEADGCGNVLLYAFSSDRAESISVRADGTALRLSTTPRSFDIGMHPDALTVTVVVHEQAMRDTSMCHDFVPVNERASETWRAVAGRITIGLSPSGIRARQPYLYRATIQIEGAEFIDSSGRRHRQAAPIVLSAIVGSGPG